MFWSITQELLGLLKFYCHFWVPWAIHYMHVLLFKKVLIILRYSTKHANFWIGCCTHLRDILKLCVVLCIRPQYGVVTVLCNKPQYIYSPRRWWSCPDIYYKLDSRTVFIFYTNVTLMSMNCLLFISACNWSCCKVYLAREDHGIWLKLKRRSVQAWANSPLTKMLPVSVAEEKKCIFLRRDRQMIFKQINIWNCKSCQNSCYILIKVHFAKDFWERFI